MDSLREYMIKFGYTDKDINKILSNSVLSHVNIKTLYKKVVVILSFLKSKGYTERQIIKMTKDHPQMFGYTSLMLDRKIDDLMKRDYSYELILKITCKCPQIYGLSINSIEYKMQEIMKLGYSREEVLMMIKSFPELYVFCMDNIKQKITDLRMLGYSVEDVHFITINFPHIFSLSIDNIREKVNFLDSIGLSDIILSHPKRLIQSVDLSYARYVFLQAMGEVIDKDNYHKLFVNEMQFSKQYKVTNSELIELYKYDRVCEKSKKLDRNS